MVAKHAASPSVWLNTQPARGKRQMGALLASAVLCFDGGASGRGVVIGSAWRCTTFQPSPSRRKIMVTRSAMGLISAPPPSRALL